MSKKGIRVLNGRLRITLVRMGVEVTVTSHALKAAVKRYHALLRAILIMFMQQS
jgi:flagellar basal body-associated protein FliL